jgi:hypothetical protein
MQHASHEAALAAAREPYSVVDYFKKLNQASNGF